MLGIGDGIALAGVCGVAITAIAKWGGSKLPSNGYIRKTTFAMFQGGLDTQLADIKADINALFGEFKDLNNHIRGLK